MSNALPKFMYRNPEEVLERKQEAEARKSCIGCKHGFVMMFKGVAAMGCDKSRRYGRRCELYERGLDD